LIVGFFVLIPFLLFFDVSFFFYPSFCYELLIRLSSGTEFFALFRLGLDEYMLLGLFFFFTVLDGSLCSITFLSSCSSSLH
jgi:hypothetical protein